MDSKEWRLIPGMLCAWDTIIRLFTNLYNVPCPISLSVTCRSENSPPVSCKPGHSWPYSTRPIPEVTVILKSPKSIWASVLIPESWSADTIWKIWKSCYGKPREPESTCIPTVKCYLPTTIRHSKNTNISPVIMEMPGGNNGRNSKLLTDRSFSRPIVSYPHYRQPPTQPGCTRPIQPDIPDVNTS